MKKILISFLTIFLFAGTLMAQTNIYVSQFRGSDANNGESWQTAYQSIDAALDRVANNPGTFVIKVSQGQYLLEDNKDVISDGYTSEYRLAKDQVITIQGGYATPSAIGEPSYNPKVYVSIFDTQDRSSQSAFRIIEGANTKLTFKDLSVLNARQGNNYDASFVTLDGSVDASLTFDNVTINEWRGGNGEFGRGFVYVFNAINTKIDINNSLVQRTLNTGGAGQFVRVNDGTKNIDINVNESVFRNLRGIGINSALFLIELDCNADAGQSSMTITKSKFHNNKRGLVTGQSASVIKATGLPSLVMKENTFLGNAGGSGGVILFKDSGELISQDNIYQGNFGGYAGNVYVLGSYGCQYDGITNNVTFENDKFFSNRVGVDGVDGRGAAIMIAGTQTGDFSSDKVVSITNSEFVDNRTYAHSGGAVFINTTQDATVTNSVFCGNESNRFFKSNSLGSGGALYVNGKGKLTVTNSTFTNNKANQHGGAIRVKKPEFLLDGCSTFDGNEAGINGGAISGSATIFEFKDALFQNNKANVAVGAEGGALHFDGGANSSGTITDAHFINNETLGDGGAILSTIPINITNALFKNNRATGNLAGQGSGGAIQITGNLNLTNVNFDGNKANRNGGAVVLAGLHQHTFTNTNFYNNTAGQASNHYGGAIYAGSAINTSSSLLTVLNSTFQENQAGGDGGAIYLNNYGIVTGTAEDTNSVIFYKNKTLQGNGGAICSFSTTIGTDNDHFFVDSKFIENNAGNSGGALYFAISATGDVQLVNNEFLNNDAKKYGGAIGVEDIASIGDEIDIIRGNNFFMNSINGDTTNTEQDRRSDIWVGAFVGIGSIENNQLQFEPTSANYPTNRFGTLGNNNTQSTGIDYTHVEKTINLKEACTIVACPVPPNVPPTPIIASASKKNSGEPDDYTPYTVVTVDGDCVPAYAEVAFTARSNDIATGNPRSILEAPLPELLIYYNKIVTNSLTGQSTTTQHTITAKEGDATIRVEDPSQEIISDDGGVGARDIYKTYFLQIPEGLKAGYTYTYVITKIDILSEKNPRSFEYNVDKYKTTIVTDFCDSDQDGIPNYLESPTGKDPKDEDTDGDGTPDYMDPDTPGFVDENGDGIDDKYDTDGDGQPDFLDIDSDNDGILDSEESGMDASDPTAPTSPIDTDGDGVPDYLDLDSDNDGINDVDEGNPEAKDEDGDGMVDGPYGNNGLADSLEGGDDTFGATVMPPADTDGDGIPDYQDIDSDNDGTPDSIDSDPYGNGTVPQSQDPSADANGDGIVDTVEDADGDGIADSVDVDQTGGTDSDGNGIDDNFDAVGNPGSTDMDGDGIVDEHDPDKDGDGIADVVDNNPNVFGEGVICEIDANTDTTNIKPTKVGISTLKRWSNKWLEDPNNKLGAYIVLESTTKGFVIPRMTTAQVDKVGTDTNTGVEEGMIVFDTDDNCLKMFYDNNNDGTMTWNCVSSDSCINNKP